MVTPLTIEPIIYRHELRIYRRESKRTLNERRLRKLEKSRMFLIAVFAYAVLALALKGFSRPDVLLDVLGASALIAHSAYA